MKRIFVADISAFTGSFTEQFQIGEIERRLKKDGQAYLTLALKDRSGEIPGKLWEIPAGFSVTDGDFVKVEAEIGTYRDELQLSIRRIRKLAREEVELGDFLPASRRDRNEMLDDLHAALSMIGNDHPGLRDALLRLIDDLAPALVDAPAAKSNHHAYLGGLLEHVLSLIGLAERVCGQYPELDRDVLVAGAVLHDIGKVVELCYDAALGYSRRGTLVGHCVLGVEILSRCSEALDDATRDHLEHIIVSHHGQAEWGAVKIPMTREARVFHLLDMIDAQMAMMNAAFHHATDGNGFTSFVPALRTALWNGHS
jgi:3'-5' exoribonuclease